MDRKKETEVYRLAVEHIPVHCRSFKATKAPEDFLKPLALNTLLMLKACHTLLTSDASDDRCVEFMSFVHRAFLSDAFLAVEFVFESLARNSMLDVVALEKHRAAELFEEFKKINFTLDNRKLQKWLINKKKAKPTVMDIIHSVLDKVGIDGKAREEIDSSINALRLLRNKVSHGLPLMSDEELKAIREVNLPIESDEQGMLTFAVHLYVPVIQWLEDFFKELYSSGKIKIS